MTKNEKEFAQKVFLAVYPQIVGNSANKARVIHDVNGHAVDTTTFMNSEGAATMAREFADAAVKQMRDTLTILAPADDMRARAAEEAKEW
jgi:uncharacterized protein (DUF3084 family)